MIALLLLLAFVPSVLSFGALGHELIASIAQRLLTDKTHGALAKILDPSPVDLAVIAPWADRIKRTHAYYWSGTLHYVNPLNDNPPSTCIPDFSHVTSDRNLLNAIANYTARLGDESLSKWSREEALRFLVHFIGDSEQPLHLTGRGRGGNDIRLRFNGRSTNLHSVWDGMLISKLQRTLNPVRIQYNQFLSYLLEELDSKYLNMTGRWLGCQVPARGGGQFVLQNPSASSHLVAQEDCVETWLEDTHRLNCNGVWSFDKPEIAREEYLIGRDYVQDYWAKEYGYESKHLEARVGQYFDIDLSQGEYWDWVWEEDIVQKMLIRGGVRLAGVLNRIFDS